MKLPINESRCLDAAIGWTELGNHLEAIAELQNMSPQYRPVGLEVLWQIFIKAKKWDACLDLANAILKMAPDKHVGYIHRSYALRRIQDGGLQKAYDALLEAVDKCPRVPLIRYNLACYQAQLGNLDLARTWLAKAFEIGDAKQLKTMALNDPDLEPLWPELGKT